VKDSDANHEKPCRSAKRRVTGLRRQSLDQ
jgi:hypothetical protein